MQDTKTLLSVLAHTVNVEDTNAMTPLFNELLNRQTAYSNIGFISPDGMALASAVPFKAPVYAGSRAYFTRAIENRAFSVGDYQIGAITRVASINFGYPVMKQGSLKGVLFAALPITVLDRKLSSLPIQQGQFVMIADSAGTVLARYPYDEKWIGRTLKDSELASLLESGESRGVRPPRRRRRDYYASTLSSGSSSRAKAPYSS